MSLTIIYILFGLFVACRAFEKWYGDEYRVYKANGIETDDSGACLWLLFATMLWPLILFKLFVENEDEDDE